MIGYIVVEHYHYDSTEPAEEPLIVYLDKEEAEAKAESLSGSNVTGHVWEIELPNV